MVLVFPILSGVFAALSSIFLQEFLLLSTRPLLATVIYMSLIALSNVCMWYLYSSALSSASSSLSVTALNQLTNLLVTVTFSYTMSTSLMYSTLSFWAGLTLLCMGSILLNSSQNELCNRPKQS